MVPQFIKDIQAKKPMTPFTVDYGIQQEDDWVLRPERDMSKVFQAVQPKPQPQEQKWKTMGFNNENEYKIAVWMKNDWFTKEEIRQALNQYKDSIEPLPEKKDWNLLQDIGWALKVDWRFEINPEDNNTLIGSMKNSLKQLANAGRFAVNLPWDTIEFVGDIGQMILNPIDTVKWVAQVWDAIASKIGITEDNEQKQAIRDAISQSIKDNFGTFEAAMNTIEENPFDTLTTIFWGATLAKSGLQKAGASAETIAKLDELAKLSNPLTVAKAELQAGKLALWQAGNLVSWTGKKLWNLTEFALWGVTGLQPETISQIFKRPEIIKSWITRESNAWKVLWALDSKLDELRNTSKWYEKVDSFVWNIWVNEIQPSKILEKFDIKVIDGALDFSNSPIGDIANQNAIRNAYNLINERLPRIDSGKSIRNLRKALDDTINYKSEATDAAKSIVREMRANIDSVAKRDIPWLKEIDSKYAKDIKEFQDVKKMLFKADGDMKENYLTTIAKLTEKWNKVKLEKIKKIIPDIEDDINALKALEDIEYAGWRTIWAYARWGLQTWSVVLWATWALNPLAALWAFLITNPAVVTKIVQAAWYSARTVWSIAEKIKNWIKLTAQEAQIVSKAVKSQINEQALKGKEALWGLVDDVADKVGARAKFMDDTGRSLDDFDALDFVDKKPKDFLKLWENNLDKLYKKTFDYRSELIDLQNRYNNWYSPLRVREDIKNIRLKYGSKDIYTNKDLDIDEIFKEDFKTISKLNDRIETAKKELLKIKQANK